MRPACGSCCWESDRVLMPVWWVNLVSLQAALLCISAACKIGNYSSFRWPVLVSWLWDGRISPAPTFGAINIENWHQLRLIMLKMTPQSSAQFCGIWEPSIFKAPLKADGSIITNRWHLVTASRILMWWNGAVMKNMESLVFWIC